jgi:general L-amino acid transport system permease protein
LAAVAGLSYGLWSRFSRRELVFLGLVAAFLLGFIARGEAMVLVVAAIAIGGGAYAGGRRVRATVLSARIRQAAVAGWIMFLPLGWVLLFAFGAPSSSQIGGFLLNVVLAAVSLTASLPVGIALALGRASRFRTLKYGCISIIEFVRAGPLLVWIFMAQFVLPDFLPGFVGDVDLIVRVIIVLTVFTSAYIAEIVRGGLQSVDRGQVEAAEAVGLGAFTITFWIVLPQALRAVIPAMVSQLISLWKDTSLVAIIGAFDLLRVAQATQSQPDFRGTPHEVFLFAALMFWLVAFTMSRLSRRLEGTLGFGTR